MTKAYTVSSGTEVKQVLRHVCRELEALLRKSEELGGGGDRSLENAQAILREVPARLEEGVLRVAVVGPIKSGKSTFLNCLLGDEMLKRGAGVITSIITRIRRGDRLQANMVFKTWPEVNEEIRQAMILFPERAGKPEDGGFDLRRDQDRLALSRALSSLGVERRVDEDALDRNLALLSGYLKGYETVRPFLADRPAVLQFEGDRFLGHWSFSGEEAHAVYLKDLQIDVAGGIPESLEIADCQGSDSPNPLHLAMIQDYLHRAHLLLYIISSRTGLRRADVQFLSMLRRMGILENVLFVLNVDFNEHPGLEDLTRLRERVRGELAHLVPEPALYAFSALYHLFQRIEGRLALKERKLLEGWLSDPELTAWSEREMRRFQEDFGGLVGRQSLRLLFQNPIERLHLAAAGISRWAALAADFLGRDAQEVRAICERLQGRRERFGNLAGLMQNALSGALPQLREELKSDVHRFLDPPSGEVMQRMLRFIDGYHLSADRFLPLGGPQGFSRALYQAYQEFKQALDRFITDEVNPDIVRFVAGEERKIEEGLTAAAAPYRIWIEEACEDLRRQLAEQGIALDCPGQDLLPSIRSFLQVAHEGMPTLSAGIGYPARIRSEALLRLGVYRVLGRVRKTLKKPGSTGAAELRAFEKAVSRLKREARDALSAQFVDFRENLKFAHLFRLADEAARRLAEGLRERLEFYDADFRGLAGRLQTLGEAKEGTRQSIARLQGDCQEVIGALEDLRRAVAACPS
ncbi:MAG: dynamin family protein [Desulfobacterales bacterium]